MTLQRTILDVAAWLVPRAEREEWLREWRSELSYVSAARPREATAFCLGAFRDALWMQRNGAPSERAGLFQPLNSPLLCGLLLAALAVMSVWAARQSPVAFPILPHLLLILIAILILPAITSLRMGEYPSSGHSLPYSRRGVRWAYLGLKVASLLLIVSCGLQSLMAGWPAIEGHILLIGYVLAFRWALIDQRRRCPICLRLLINPTPIGTPSQTLLAWYGTELVCSRGHGLLYVSGVSTSCSNTQRWQSLDPSWSGLFPQD